MFLTIPDFLVNHFSYFFPAIYPYINYTRSVLIKSYGSAIMDEVVALNILYNIIGPTVRLEVQK